ncbi:MAG: hypothetical protein ACWA6Y_13755 [Polaromonas sp.]
MSRHSQEGGFFHAVQRAPEVLRVAAFAIDKVAKNDRPESAKG